KQPSRALDVVGRSPRELARLQRDHGRILEVIEHAQTTLRERDDAVDLTALRSRSLDRTKRSDVTRERGRAVVVGDLERLPIKVRGHVRVLQPDLPDVAEVGEQTSPINRIGQQARAAILELLNVLEVTTLGEDRLGHERGLLIGRLAVEGLEQ